MKRTSKILIFVFLGIFSFLFFLYFTFPYEVLKEAVAMRASDATGLSIQVGELGPALPLGIKAKNVKITTPAGNYLQLSRADVRIGLLNFLLGKASVYVDLVDEASGTLNLVAKFGLFKVVTGKVSLPSNIYLDAKKFLFGKIINFVLAMKAQEADVNLMVKPLLESVDIDGKLNALVDLSIDESDLTKSEGEASLSLDGMTITSLNSNLTLPAQHFTKALLKGVLKNGTLTFDNNCGFTSQDLTTTLTGKIVQKPDMMKSNLDIDLGIQLGAPLREQFDIILFAIANKETNGKLDIKISGPLSPAPTVAIQ